MKIRRIILVSVLLLTSAFFATMALRDRGVGECWSLREQVPLELNRKLSRFYEIRFVSGTIEAAYYRQPEHGFQSMSPPEPEVPNGWYFNYNRNEPFQLLYSPNFWDHRGFGAARLDMSWPPDPDHVAWVVKVPTWLPAVIALACALWLVIRWRRGVLTSGVLCERCAYNLTGNISGNCPECGAACKAEN